MLLVGNRLVEVARNSSGLLQINENIGKKRMGEAFAIESTREIVGVLGESIFEGSSSIKHGKESVIAIAKSAKGYILIEQFGKKSNWDGAGLPFAGNRLGAIGTTLGSGWHSWKNNFPYELRSRGKQILIVDSEGVLTGSTEAQSGAELSRTPNPNDSDIAISATFHKSGVATLYRNLQNRKCYVILPDGKKLETSAEAVKIFDIRGVIVTLGSGGEPLHWSK
jgi:hypothetical protein